MKIHPNTQEAYQLLHDGTLAFGRAERQGIRVDVKYVERKKKQLTRKISKLEEEFKSSKFYKHWSHVSKNVNINSNAQLSHYLYRVKKLEPAKLTTLGQGATDEEALEQLNIPELNDLLKIRKLKKIRDTYLDSFLREQVDGYIHPFFNLNTVRSFRSSSDKPNFQNIPKRDKEAMLITRKGLFPRPGHQLLEVDYSGLEVRIAACYHKDKTMIKYINDPTSDMHGDTAQEIFFIKNIDKKIPSHNILRQAAKNGFVFPQFYGDYYKNNAITICEWVKLPHRKWKEDQGIELEDSFISDHLISKGITSYDKFTDHLKNIETDFWKSRFVEYGKWKERWWKGYQKTGYIDLYTGFRCSGLMGKNDCINYPVQGAAFHCLLWSFIELDRIMQRDNWNTKLIGQIHDAIIFDVDPEELDIVIKTIKRVTCEDLPKAWNWINVPLDVEVDVFPVDGSWTEKIK